MFFNKSLKSHIFYECLSQYKDISIEIEYPSESFKSIIDLVFKIHNKNFKQLKIGIVITSFAEEFSDICFSKDVSYHRIDSSIQIIPLEAFKKCSSLKQIVIPSSVTKIGNSAFYECSSLKQILIPSSVTKIGYYAFSGCSSLLHFTIPFSVIQIENSAFNGRYSKKS